MKIILASKSPRRQELLHLIVPEFDIEPCNLDEAYPEKTHPSLVPEFLAAGKAGYISQKHKDALVIGSDTCVIIDDMILGKPKDKDDAVKMLTLLSGKTHEVITGCCICLNGNKMSFSERTLVTFRSLTKEEIDLYVSSGEPFDKAGGYGIQGKAALFIKGINGDYYNVMGLPVCRLNTELKEFF